MSERTSVWRKLFARRRFTALVVAFAATLGLTITSMGAASASGSNCAVGMNQFAQVCTQIDGYSNVIRDAIGSATTYTSIGNGYTSYPGHVQVINPNGTTLCNSDTVTLNAGVGMSCETPDLGATYTGNYCTILWAYFNGGYHNYGEDCFFVYTS